MSIHSVLPPAPPLIPPPEAVGEDAAKATLHLAIIISALIRHPASVAMKRLAKATYRARLDLIRLPALGHR